MYIYAILNISVAYNLAGKVLGNVLLSPFYTRNFYVWVWVHQILTVFLGVDQIMTGF